MRTTAERLAFATDMHERHLLAPQCWERSNPDGPPIMSLTAALSPEARRDRSPLSVPSWVMPEWLSTLLPATEDSIPTHRFEPFVDDMLAALGRAHRLGRHQWDDVRRASCAAAIDVARPALATKSKRWALEATRELRQWNGRSPSELREIKRTLETKPQRWASYSPAHYYANIAVRSALTPGRRGPAKAIRHAVLARAELTANGPTSASLWWQATDVWLSKLKWSLGITGGTR